MKNLKEEINILYVDDEKGNREAFKASFRRNYTIHAVETAEEGLKVLENNTINIVITDQRMPKMTGAEFLTSIVNVHPEPMRMIMTGYADLNAVIDAVNNGKVYKYLTKPWDADQLKMIIDEAYNTYSLQQQQKKLLKDLLRVNEQLEFQLMQKSSFE
jgi:response regulator RpfG family c-di-GMP phosphodiesterase